MGRTKDGSGNRRNNALSGFSYWWEDLKHEYQEKKERNIKPMGKQKLLDDSMDPGPTGDSGRVPERSKRANLVGVARKPFTAIKRFFQKVIDNAKVFMYNVNCSIAKRKDKIMAKDNNTSTPEKQSAKKGKTEKKQLNWFVSGIITIGIMLAWVSAAYCVILVNTGTGDDMFPKYASAPLAVVVVAVFVVAVFYTIRNNFKNR